MTEKRRGGRVRLAVTTMAVGALALAGCGSSSSGDEAGANGQPPIVLGAVGTYTGPFSSTYGGVPQVIDAWVETVNAGGGIKGRPVRVIKKDIGGSPAAGTAAARELLDREQVLAIVPNQDPAVAGWASRASAKGVPIITATTETDSMINPDNFSVQGSSLAVVYGLGEQARQLGGRLGLAYCAEQPACAQQSALLQLGVEAQGVEVPVAAKVPVTSADFTTYCQQFRRSRVDAIFNSLSDELAVRMSEACAEQGVEATQVISGATTNPAWKTNPAYRGSVVLDPVAPFFETKIPGVAAYRKALEEHASSLIDSPQDNSVALRAWAALQAFAAAAERVDGELTSEAVQDALVGLNGETLDGIVPPLAF